MTLKNTLFWKFDTIRVVPPLVGVVPIVETLVGVVPPLVGVVPIVETLVGVVPPLIAAVPIVETLVGLVPIVETLVVVSYFIYIHVRVIVLLPLSFPSCGTLGM